MPGYLKALTTQSVFCVLLLGSSLASAQVSTGTIAGKVMDQNGGVIPGATVSIESPSLQGVQRTTTSPNGDYIFRFLPPGPYTLTVEAKGFGAKKSPLTLSAQQTATVDVTVTPAAVSETVTVEAGDATTFTKTIQASTNIKTSLLQELPTARTLLSAVDLSPSIHATAPNGARSISGGFSYENAFLLNGVRIQDNLRGTPFSLFIEDAIQETTTTTAGVSAEYGQFTGGVVNAITKSGSNDVRGSYRATVTNDDWRTVSPFGERKTSATIPTHEFTIGGPILRNRTWFFGAGRVVDQTLGRETGLTKIPYDFEDSEQRFEGKLTQAVGTGHRLEVSFINIERTQTNNAFPSVSLVTDLKVLTTRKTPQRLFSAHYTGSVSPNFAVEGQLSLRRFSFVGDGGLDRDRIQGTPVFDSTTGEIFWAPVFCGVCVDEGRNNDEVILKGSYFRSTGWGSHSATFGYDTYNDNRKAENHASASDFWLYASSAAVRDTVVYPVVEPFSTVFIHWPITEATKGTSFRTHSLFFNDNWAANRHLSFNLGVRYDKNDGKDSARNTVANDSALSPRLGVVFDPRGDGRVTFNASYSRYVAAIASSDNVANGASAAGVPSILVYLYDGAPINTVCGEESCEVPSGPLTPTDAVLQQVFDWYDTTADKILIQATVPGIGIKIPKSLKSPHVDEFAFGVSHLVGDRGTLRFDVVDRKWGDFYANRIDPSTGQATDQFGQRTDVQFIENTNIVKRRYTAFLAQGTYRATNDLFVGGSYTLSKLRGNINGEDVGSGPLGTDALRYPEYFDLRWSFPEGDLAADQRHRARLWGSYTLPGLRDRNRLSVGVIQLMESGTPYGAAAEVVMGDINGSPLFFPSVGYAAPPVTATYFFTPRDEFHTAAMYRTDLSVNYAFNFGSQTRNAEFFVQAQIRNLFNQFQLFNMSADEINTTVLTANDDPDRFETFNPFAQTPVEGVHWAKGTNFGKARSKDAYTLPRTFLFSLGARF